MQHMKTVRNLADRHPTLEMRVAKFKDRTLTWHSFTTKQLFDEACMMMGAPPEDPTNGSDASGKKLHVRDLRLIDPNNSVPCRPIIMVRERSIVIKLEDVRGIIMHNAVLLMEYQGMNLRDDRQRLEDKFCVQWDPKRVVGQDGHYQPFEFFAVEVLLDTVLKGFEFELRCLKKEVEELSTTCRSEMSLRMLDQLRKVKGALSDLYKRGDGVRIAIGTILESDEEMDMMYLSFANDERSTPGITIEKVYGGHVPRRASNAASFPPVLLASLSGMPGNGNTGRESARVSRPATPGDEDKQSAEIDAALRNAVLMTGGTLHTLSSLAAVEQPPLVPPSHDEIEVLLESFLQSISNVNHEVEQIKSGLDAQEHMIELTLDLTRNTLLRLDMIFQIMTFSVSVGALVAGILGMNLMNRAEASEYAFAITAGGIMIGVITLMCVMYFVATRWFVG
jgi:hypothetical protein